MSNSVISYTFAYVAVKNIY